MKAAAIEMICTYQLGDKARATRLRDKLLKIGAGAFLPPFLCEKFQGTCQVLDLLPSLLDAIQEMAKEGNSGGNLDESEADSLEGNRFEEVVDPEMTQFAMGQAVSAIGF